jgi:outer membrane lipoprotein-sorting protein
LTFLRRISTRKLIALCALTLVVVIGGATVAVATSGGGPELANAVHDALDAPAVPGISADISFTNGLLDAASFEGSYPLLTGASGRLWASPADGGKLRLELQAEQGGNDSQILVEGRKFEIYDGSSETVYRGTIPEEKGEAADQAWEWTTPSVERVQKAIDRAGKHAELSGAIPSNVAGEPAYTLRAAPRHDGGLLGGVEVAWDASNGIPLRAAVYAAGNTSPVLELEATDVSFEAVDASVFEISAPESAKVVDLNPAPADDGEHGKPTTAVGVDAVAAAVDFPLTAPASLAGLPRSDVRAIEVDGHSAALVTYGKGLGGIAVIQSPSEPGAKGESVGEGLSLPEVVIGDVKGKELDTALGSALWFSRDGVDYVVIGSVPPAAVEAAARAL